MATLIIAAALVMGFIVSLIIQTMTTEAPSRRGLAIKRLPLVALILGAFVLSTACSTTTSGTGTKGYSSKKPVGYVKRAIFTTKITKREPTNNISELLNNQQKIYFFTDLRGMEGEKIKHRWIYKGKVRSEVEFKVKGPRWRVYSIKSLKPGWLGKWTVATVDRSGRTLARKSFVYVRDPGFFGQAGKLYKDLFGED